MKRIGLGFMSLFLLLATVVQLNDPDGYIWMLVYGLPAAVSACACLITGVMDQKWWYFSCIATLSALVAFSFVMMSSYFYHHKIPLLVITTEEGREFAGLTIALSWMVLLTFQSSLHNYLNNFWGKNVYFLFSVVPVFSWIVYKCFIEKRIELPDHCSTML